MQSSVLSTGGGKALINPADTVILLLDHEQRTFKTPKIDRIIPLSEGRTAYEQVARGEARGRLVLAP
jgi:hypothetical protein